MISIKFKNFEKSELAREVVFESFQGLLSNLSDLKNCKIQVVLEMEKCRSHLGPDLFKVNTHFHSDSLGDISVVQSDPSLYTALDLTVNLLLKELQPTKKARQMSS